MTILRAALVASLAAATASADFLPAAREPVEPRIRATYEILPADGQPLSGTLASIEGVRLVEERKTVSGRSFVRATFVLPIRGDDPHERVLFLSIEDGWLRLLGFHQIRRRPRGPEGQTLVFDSGAWNPLEGEELELPPDTYSRLSLFTALEGLAANPRAVSVYLWNEEEQALPFEIAPDGTETLEALGTEIRAQRFELRRRGIEASARYWLDERPPHPLLQYEGPSPFFEEEGPIRLRAASSSVHVRRMLAPDPD